MILDLKMYGYILIFRHLRGLIGFKEKPCGNWIGTFHNKGTEKKSGDGFALIVHSVIRSPIIIVFIVSGFKFPMFLVMDVLMGLL